MVFLNENGNSKLENGFESYCNIMCLFFFFLLQEIAGVSPESSTTPPTTTAGYYRVFCVCPHIFPGYIIVPGMFVYFIES